MNELTSGSTVLTLAGVAALLTAAALALERARVLPVPGSVLGWLGVAVMALGLIRVIHSDGSLIYTFPTMAAFGIGWVIGLLGMARESRARFAEVFATIAPAIDGKVVASDAWKGVGPPIRWRCAWSRPAWAACSPNCVPYGDAARGLGRSRVVAPSWTTAWGLALGGMVRQEPRPSGGGEP